MGWAKSEYQSGPSCIVKIKSRMLNAFMTQSVNGAYFKLCFRFGPLSCL
jgi:hypothetical protein